MSDQTASMLMVARLQDMITPGLDVIEDHVKKVGSSAASSLRPWDDEMGKLSEGLNETIIRLRAQKDLLQDPVYQQSAMQAAKLRAEISELTKAMSAEATAAKAVQTAESAADTAESSIFSNMRVRREAIVMAHEGITGSYKRMLGSAMVFGEYSNAGWMEKLTASINPYTIAMAAAGVAIVGTTVKLVELTEKQAENYHEMGLLASRFGGTAEEMTQLQDAFIGTGVSTKDVAAMFGKFTLNLDKNRESLASIGVTSKDPIQAFAQLLDATKSIQDPTLRDEILMKNLGRSWQEVAPLAAKGGATIRDAVAQMHIPESTKKDYEEINALHEQEARDWDLIKAHSSGALSSIIADLSRYKAGLLDIAAHRGILEAAGAAFNPRLRASLEADLALDRSTQDRGTGSAAAGALTNEQQKALEASKKELAKKNVDLAIQEVKDEWKGRLSEFREGSKEYLQVAAAEAQAEQDVRDSFAKKNKGKKPKSDDSARSSLYDMVGRDEREAQSSAVAASGDSSVSASIMAKSAAELKRYENARAELLKARDRLTVETAADAAQVNAGLAALAAQHQSNLTKIEIDGEAKQDKAHDEAIQKYLAKEKKADNDKMELMKKRFQEEEAEAKAAGADEGESFADAWMLAVDSRLSKTKSVIEQVADLMMSTMDGAINSVSSNLTGAIMQTKSWRSALSDVGTTIGTDVLNSVIKLGLQWVEEQVLRSTMATATNAVVLAEGTATAAGLASAYAAPAALASVATLGAADAAGSAGLAATMSVSEGIASFDVGTPYVRGNQIAKIHDSEIIAPAGVSAAARAGNYGPMQAFLGQNTSTSTSSSSSHYHDNRSWVIPTTISRSELGPLLERTTASVARAGIRVSH